MVHQSRAKRRWGTRASAAFLPSLLLAVGGVFTSCEDDNALPEYPVPEVSLRILPEQSSVGEKGGPLFVLVELRQAADAGAQKRVVLFIKAKGASVEALPGPVFCAKPAGEKDGGATSGDAGASDAAAADADAATAEAGAGASPPNEGELTLPDGALLAHGKDGARTSGFLVVIPSGDDPVELLATAYETEGDAESCTPTRTQILGIGTARIERTRVEADAGSDADGGSDGDAADADTGADADAASDTDGGTDAASDPDSGTDAASDPDAASDAGTEMDANNEGG